MTEFTPYWAQCIWVINNPREGGMTDSSSQTGGRGVISAGALGGQGNTSLAGTIRRKYLKAEVAYFPSEKDGLHFGRFGQQALVVEAPDGSAGALEMDTPPRQEKWKRDLGPRAGKKQARRGARRAAS